MPSASPPKPRPRLGLCCAFVAQPIKFRVSTARHLLTLAPGARREKIDEICLHNATALEASIDYCAAHAIGAFRIPSQLCPLYTHPEVGYRFRELPRAAALVETLTRAAHKARAGDVRLSFHPDQFVVLGSTNEATVRASLAELEYQGEVAALVGAEQLTIHGGGAQGGKPAALERLRRGLDRLSPDARSRVVLENDDRVYTVEDLLPVCRDAGVPLVYDVHHHRCNPDGLDVAGATDAATETWGAREPWVHLSSPATGWSGGDPRPHADQIALADFPAAWRTRRLTVDVEAKGKEEAVLGLARALQKRAKS